MDVERTMQFILECQAKAEIRMQKFDERMEKADARMERAEARMEKFDARMEKAEARAVAMEKRFDRRLDGMTKLIEHGMRRLSKIEDTLVNVTRIQQEIAIEQKELARAQRETERTLKAFINSLRPGRNGG